MSNRYMARLVVLCLLRIWKISKLAQCLAFSVFHEGLQHLPVVGQFVYDTKMECFPLLANDSCPTSQFFSALHINTLSAGSPTASSRGPTCAVHKYAWFAALSFLCQWDLWFWCMWGNEGSFSPRVCRQAISWKKEVSSNPFLLVHLPWPGTQTSGHFGHV